MVDGQNTNRAEWLAHPAVQEHHWKARGDRSIESWIAEVALAGRPRKRGVGIGAGTAPLELGLVASGLVEQFDLLDVSAGALDVARRSAEEKGIAERVATLVCDVASSDLGRDRYDIATCMDSLHHVEDLDAVLGSVCRSLVSDGVLVAYEYVGPDRFAARPAEREVAQRLYRSLSTSLKSPHPELPLPDPVAVADADPTEAVHSSDILAVLRRYFRDVIVVHHGGALAYTMWWGLAHDALFETKTGWEFVELLLQVDQALTQKGDIDDYFVTIMATGPRK